MSLTEDQKEQRLSYITGSDCPTIMGINPWGDIISLWRQKLRLEVAEDISWKPVIKAGNYLEPVVAQWFSDDTGKLCEVDAELKIHKSIPFMAGNIDRKITGENAILECKTTSRDNNWGSDGDNSIPDYYLCQVAHYAAVCDVERVYVAVLIRGADFRWYTYERNQKLEDLIIKKEKEFWGCIKTETPPEARTLDEIASLYFMANEKEPLIADHTIEAAIEKYNFNKKSMNQLKEEQERLQVFIKSYMKDHDMLLDLNGKPIATWKNAKGTARFDAKSFAKDHQLLYDKYMKQGDSSRRFLIK